MAIEVRVMQAPGVSRMFCPWPHKLDLADIPLCPDRTFKSLQEPPDISLKLTESLYSDSGDLKQSWLSHLWLGACSLSAGLIHSWEAWHESPASSCCSSPVQCRCVGDERYNAALAWLASYGQQVAESAPSCLQLLWCLSRGKAVALDVAKGLHHLHSRNIIHLDLKSRYGVPSQTFFHVLILLLQCCKSRSCLSAQHSERSCRTL